jgi:hypothetical protein
MVAYKKVQRETHLLKDVQRPDADLVPGVISLGGWEVHGRSIDTPYSVG